MKPRLLFVSPRFLFPVDSGGKIRTTQVLRGMRGGAFDITLASPCPPGGEARFADDLAGVADRFVGWHESERGRFFPLTRLRWLAGSTPISVASDRSEAGARVITQHLDERPDLVVFDFLHSVALAPDTLTTPSVLFTHNVEAKIFHRHAEATTNPLLRAVWRLEHAKMARYEKAALRRFDRVVAVSGRDAEHFEKHYAVHEPRVIATGVDLDFFTYSEPGDSDQCVFTGSMDWLANIDAVKFLMDSVWPEIVRRRPSARMAVVGRSPPSDLVERARSRGLGWEFSGFVDDVRPWVRRSAVSLIPLRIGGGTRLKVYEAMALGCPVVSTSIGVEGLRLEPEREYLRADDPIGFAEAVVALMSDRERARTLSHAARDHVERHASHRAVAHDFEKICLETCARRTGTAFTPGYRDGQERLRSFGGHPLPER